MTAGGGLRGPRGEDTSEIGVCEVNELLKGERVDSREASRRCGRAGVSGQARRARREGARLLSPAVAIPLALALLAAGCGAHPGAETKVREAERLIESSGPLLQDLLGLNSRFNSLGTRYSDVDDTIAEGKSLAEMAMVNVDELEARLFRAGELLREVEEMEGAGDHAEYARLVLDALHFTSQALASNRELLTAVWDMLDLLPAAESAEQLAYYTGEIDRLTAEINALLREASEAAGAADRFREERGL